MTPLEKEVDVRRERRRKKLVMQSYVIHRARQNYGIIITNTKYSSFENIVIKQGLASRVLMGVL